MMNTTAKVLIRQSALCDLLDLSRSGLDKLRKKDPTFPKPLKDGESRQAAAYYVMAEIEAWIQLRGKRPANSPSELQH